VAATVTLGAPGIYLAPERNRPELAGVRMDVCAFAGVAPRGPCRLPDAAPDPLPEGSTLGLPRRRSVAVAVESFGAYRRLYGGFEGPGRLPFAVASFFEQGGRRAWIVRVVRDYGPGHPDNDGGVASGVLPGIEVAGSGDPVRLVARSEGSWGNRLRAAVGFTARPLSFTAPAVNGLTVDPAARPAVGTLLRLRVGAATEHAFVAETRREEGGTRVRVSLDRVLAAPPDDAHPAEIVEATLLVDDGDGRAERFAGLGLGGAHPESLAAVLCHRSELLFPHLDWHLSDLVPVAGARFGESLLPPVVPGEPPQFDDGAGDPVVDRYDDLVPDDFFDLGWTLGDEGPGAGVHAFLGTPEVATLVVPDLYSPGPLAPVEPIVEPPTLAGPEFGPCVVLPPPAEQDNPPPELVGLFLDPLDPADFDAIVGLQSRLVDLAEVTGAFAVLLDVPPGLPHRRVLDWRARFGSSYAAAYHPWLLVARPDDQRDALILLPPSAVAAGLIASRERLFGIPHGPWNAIVAEVVDAAERTSPARHDELHQAGINVYLLERDGVVLYGSRTLSRERTLRQLTVRRLMMALRRALERETWWLVFEPNAPALWAEVRRFLTLWLRRLWEVGAFRGAREEEAFFVRCDRDLNPRSSLDLGRLVVEVGVAPAEPLEFIVLRLVRGGDGTLTVEA
jgi:hypothetical protein